jgi:hypothetical protein
MLPKGVASFSVTQAFAPNQERVEECLEVWEVLVLRDPGAILPHLAIKR